jgi:YtkA-like
MFSQNRFRRGLLPAVALILTPAALVVSLPMRGASQTKSSPLTQKAGKYAVELRLPQEGLFADEENDVEFHVSDTSQDDPVQGAPPIVKAKVSARITMPSMSTMPAQSPKTHAEGVPGDYGVVLYFPHGGEFQIDLIITPPGDKAFTVSYKASVGDAQAAKGRKPRTRPYTLEVASVPQTPEAGKPALLTIFIRSRDTKQPVTDFDIVHERQIHFMVVSGDMQHFAHEHPALGGEGKFTLEYAFPTGGEYHLFADVAPKGAGSQILMQPIHVSGPVPASAGAVRFTPSLTDTVDGVKVALTADPAKLPVGRSLNITFSLQDAATNAPITDLEPYLGAMAHLMLIHQDGSTFVHSHPDETDPKNGHNGLITFLARFPKPGFYRGWLQFQRGGKVETATFTWEVRADKRA